MPEASHLAAFALVALGMVLTPGPNMIYLLSRSVSQGRAAGFVSLAGVATGFLFYMVAAALGVTALVLAIPVAYDAIRLGGAVYLLWLAWCAVRPSSRSGLAKDDLPRHPPSKLFLIGLLTNILNPKIAVMYLSLLPQFIDPSRGNVLTQSLVLGTVQILISILVNSAIVLTAGSLTQFLARRPIWLRAQKWLMGMVLASLAVRMLADGRR